MKKIPTIWITVAAQLLLILAALFAGTGCYYVDSESDVPGKYELRTGSGSITLQISPDKTFFEAIRWPSGKTANVSGRWFWSKGTETLELDGLWVPPEFAPDYILQADASTTNGVKYTDAGYWSITPERHWGTVILTIFPDADEGFRKVR